MVWWMPYLIQTALPFPFEAHVCGHSFLASVWPGKMRMRSSSKLGMWMRFCICVYYFQGMIHSVYIVYIYITIFYKFVCIFIFIQVWNVYIYTPVYTYITGMKFQHTLDLNIYIYTCITIVVITILSTSCVELYW